MDDRKGCTGSLMPPLSMVLVQIFTTGMLLLTKVVLDRGTFIFALLTYRNLVATVLIAPLAFLMERGKEKNFGCSVFMWIFLNALSGIPLAMGLYYYGLRDTSAAYASNFLNLIPILTFVLAVLLRMEKFGLSSKAGRVKILGTVICVGGAMVASLYKGEALHLWPAIIGRKHDVARVASGDHIRGALFLLASIFSFASWYLVQAKLFEVFPLRYCATMLTCIVGSVQSALVGIILNREKVAWRLRWDLQLVTIVYSGALSTAAKFCLISWVIVKRGPAYPSMFSSLAVIFTTLLDSLLMGQAITTGSLLGMTMIIGGLYAFLWGKRKEVSLEKDLDGDNQVDSDATQVQFSEQVNPATHDVDKSIKHHGVISRYL